MIQMGPFTIKSIKELIHYYFINVKDIWDDITKTKENEEPEDFAKDWLLVQEQLQIIKRTMQNLNQNDVIPIVNPKNVTLMAETLMDYFKTSLYPETFAEQDLLLQTWDQLREHMIKLRIMLVTIYNDVDHQM